MSPSRVFTALAVLLVAAPAAGDTYMGYTRWQRSDHNRNLNRYHEYNLYHNDGWKTELKGWTHVRSYAGNPYGILNNHGGESYVRVEGLQRGKRYNIRIWTRATEFAGTVRWKVDGGSWVNHYQGAGTTYLYFKNVVATYGYIKLSAYAYSGTGHVHWHGLSLYSVNSCAAGKYTSTGNDAYESCKNCPAGQSSGTGKTSCSHCPGGYVSSSGGTCSRCAAGKYDSSNSCKSCPAGKTSPNGKTSCGSCPAGKYTTNKQSCSNCPAGRSSPATSDHSNDCYNCPGGKVSSAGGSCADCAAGKYDSSNSCKSCAAGKTSAKAKTSCTSCSAGKYTTNKTSCSKCPAGKSSPSTSDHSNDCSTCPGGKVSAAGGSCLDCAAGKYDSSNSCKNCAAGKVSVAGKASCTTCAAGKYRHQNSCKTCANNKYSGSGQDSCSSCPANSVHNNAKDSCVCVDSHHGNGFNCIDKCTMTLADEKPTAFQAVRQKGRANGNGNGNGNGRRLLASPWLSMDEIGLSSMTRCSKNQIRRKRKEALKAIADGMKEVGDDAPTWRTALAALGMPDKLKTKASALGVTDMDMRMSKRKVKKNGNGKTQCEEADVDLREPGAYDVTMELNGDEALACVGKRPVSKLVKKTSTTYDKYCWSGNPLRGSWDGPVEVSEGTEYTCGKFDFFVESMAVVSDGATDAPTSAPTLSPTPNWYFMEYNGAGQAVQCANGNEIQCASDDGINCNVYNGSAWDTLGSNDAPVVSSDSPKVMTCPGWISHDGEDPCDQLDCYMAASQLSGGLGEAGVYTTDYNMGISDAGAVYKCNHGHRKCAVCTADARYKFVEVVPADMPNNLIFYPAETFAANATDGSFSVEGNFVVYMTTDTRVEHHMPFAHPDQQ